MAAAGLLLVGSLAAAPLWPSPAKADGGSLALPSEQVPASPPPLADGTVDPDAAALTRAPGRVDSTEAVAVGVDATGAPAAVTDALRVSVSGSGDYVFRARVPALSGTTPADADGEAAIVRPGQVTFEGFSTGSRTLGADLVLDPLAEQLRLPVTVALAGADGGPLPSALAPGASFTVTLTSPPVAELTSAAADVDPAAVAVPLDALRAATAPGVRPPLAGSGLPASVPLLSAPALTPQDPLRVPLRVTGTIGTTDSTGVLSGPGTSGSTVTGTLTGAATFTVAAPTGGVPVIDLEIDPVLDPRLLTPPGGAASWAAWAASAPDLAARQAAVTTLDTAAQTAAAVARAVPHVSALVPGTATATFRYTLAPPGLDAPAPVDDLHPRVLPIVLTSLGVLGLLAGFEVVRRRV